LKNLIVVAALSFVSSAFAQSTGSGYDVLSEYGNRTAYLEHCGGTARLTETYENGARRPSLQISGVQNCSNIIINGENSGKLDNGSAERTIYEHSGLNINTITLESNSGKTSDTVRVQSFGETPVETPSYNPTVIYTFGVFASEFGSSKIASLPNCGGTAKVTVTDGETINVVFKNLQQCSKFDILKANDEKVDYPTKKIPAEVDRQHGGSFTIPAYLVKTGQNSIKVIVRSDSAKTYEVLLIRFSNY
jgi:hypothetical protein